MGEDHGDTWPEQDAIDAWWRKSSLGLKAAASEHRIKLDQEMAFLKKKLLHFSPIEELGELMTLERWRNACGSLFCTGDGFGMLATATEESNIEVYPREKDETFPDWATHVVWYNR